MGYRLPGGALVVLAGIAIIAVAVIITVVYGALHGISPL